MRCVEYSNVKAGRQYGLCWGEIVGEAMYYAPRLRYMVGTSCTGTLRTYIQDIGVRPPGANLPGELKF